MKGVYFDLLELDEKAEALTSEVAKLRAGTADRTFVVDQETFCLLPGSPIAYWLNLDTRQRLSHLPRFESEGRAARLGDHPSEDFRYLRLFWEPSPGRSSLVWKPYQKGGDYSPYFYDLPLVVDWDPMRQTYRGFYGRKGRSSERPSNCQYFFRPGLTWPRRSQRGFSVRALPSGSIFADKGPSVFVEGDHAETLLAILAVLNSKIFGALLEIQIAFGSYEVGAVQRSPFPLLEPSDHRKLAILARRAHRCTQAFAIRDETTHAFVVPGHSDVPSGFGTRQFDEQGQMDQDSLLEIVQQKIDDLAGRLFGFDDQTIQMLYRHFGSDESSEEEGLEEDAVDDNDRSGPRRSTHDLVSWAVGVVFGRWDVRLAVDPSLAPQLQGPFDPLPICPPGMLVGPDALPAKCRSIASEAWLRARPDAISLPPEGSIAEPVIPDEAYPLRIDWDGILVDDEGHDDDIVRRMRDVLALLWDERAEAIEQEACSILAVRNLRDHLRNPRGFWDFHVKRYSKSRRKAPIYWLLQSSKRAYGLWLYYPRLDADTLFKALGYVGNRLLLEQARLDEALGQRQAMGDEGDARTRRQLEKRIEAHEAFISEVTTFRVEFQRVADLGLTVDHDDGVLLSIAPLHNLVPWPPAKAAWNELLSGKYGWSSIGKQLRAKGLIREAARG